MYKWFLHVAGLVALNALGCGPANEFKVTGFVVEVPTTHIGDTPSYGFVDAEQIEFEDFLGNLRPLDNILDDFTKKSQLIRTKQFVKLSARYKEGSRNGQRFEAILGPTPGRVDKFAVGTLKHGSYSIFIGFGWVYAYGTKPKAGTLWGDAGADGSALLVHDRGVDHVFYLLEGQDSYYPDTYYRYPESTGPKMHWRYDSPAYLILGPDGPMDETPKPLADAPREITLFLDMVKPIIEAGGAPWPLP